jgi:hypothetical protein
MKSSFPQTIGKCVSAFLNTPLSEKAASPRNTPEHFRNHANKKSLSGVYFCEIFQRNLDDLRILFRSITGIELIF